ncbi:MAG: UDP-N-acetylglucosamine 1-carboxyvinyltransferase, partial [bacterium]|nr:UDP-N-acetylglucosamine 1-carboxyvinyltransferase [bacterium]
FAVLLTQASGTSIIHERLFENRFSYVDELKKLGAEIEFFDPKVTNPKEFYHFNWEEGKEYKQAIKIKGGGRLHNAVLDIKDLRAGAALACAALISTGESIVNGVSQLERGYEDFINKIRALGGKIEV